MSEEKRFGICKEPFQTCPMIDEVIDGLNEVDKIVHKFKNSEDPELLRDCLSDILDNLPSERQMENIRENIIAIRSWSEEWKQFGVQLQTLVPGPTESEFDARAGAYESGLGTRRDKPADVVRASINALPSGKIMVCVAKGTMGQRIFGALFPPAFVVKKVAEMFRPKPG